MSLSTRGHSAPKKPGVHYFSPFFDPVAHEAAQQALRPAPARAEKLSEADWRKRPGNEGSKRAKPHVERAMRRGNEPEEVRIFCAHFNLQLNIGQMLYRLWKARGEVVPPPQNITTMQRYSGVIWRIRRSAPGLQTHCEPGLGYALYPAAVAKLDALIAERLGKPSTAKAGER